MKQRIIYILLLLLITVPSSIAQHREAIPYAHFEQWVTRHITESPILGGNARSLYAIAPDTVINGAVAYRNLGGSPWATSNAYANIIGIKKVSCTAVPENREGGGKCARLDSKLEVVRVLGMVDIEVLISGSIYLGELYEPIRSVNNPYGKMTMGIPFTKRPKKLIFDYNLTMSKNGNRIYSTGLSPKKVVQGPDSAEVYILLQHRWEDEDGNVDHSVIAGQTACLILENSTMKEEGWQFLKWWMSEDTQTSYGVEVENVLGVAGRVATANMDALENLPWSSKDLKQLQAQLEWVKVVPEVPGGYYTERHVKNAFYAVKNSLEDPRETLEDYVKTINNEITNKRIEFGLEE